MGVERRASPRFACDLDTELWLGEHVSRVQTVDLSFSGICLISPEAVPLHVRADFRLRLLFAVGGTDSLLLLGETVWCTGVASGFQVGCRFLPEMPSATWRRLDLALQFVRGDLELC